MGLSEYTLCRATLFGVDNWSVVDSSNDDPGTITEAGSLDAASKQRECVLRDYPGEILGATLRRRDSFKCHHDS